MLIIQPPYLTIELAMVKTWINHASILADDLDESTQFYEDVLGMEAVPTPNFPGREVRWLQCEDLQLHLFDRDIEPAPYYHVGFHVSDFEAVYQAARESDLVGEIDEADEPQTLYELPDGSVQMYLHDPAGNLIEINHHDATELPQHIQDEVVRRADQIPQTGSAGEARLYSDRLLQDIGQPTAEIESD